MTSKNRMGWSVATHVPLTGRNTSGETWIDPTESMLDLDIVAENSSCDT